MLDKSKSINIVYLLPATVIFVLQGINVLTGTLNNFDNIKNFEGAGSALIMLMALFLCGMLAIAVLWYLVLFPAKFASLDENKKAMFGTIVFFGVLICGLNYMVSLMEVQQSYLYGYPPRDQVLRPILFALFSIGPLRIVSKLYFNWSFQRFSFWLFLLTSVLLPLPYLFAKFLTRQ